MECEATMSLNLRSDGFVSDFYNDAGAFDESSGKRTPDFNAPAIACRLIAVIVAIATPVGMTLFHASRTVAPAEQILVSSPVPQPLAPQR